MTIRDFCVVKQGDVEAFAIVVFEKDVRRSNANFQRVERSDRRSDHPGLTPFHCNEPHPWVKLGVDERTDNVRESGLVVLDSKQLFQAKLRSPSQMPATLAVSSRDSVMN